MASTSSPVIASPSLFIAVPLAAALTIGCQGGGGDTTGTATDATTSSATTSSATTSTATTDTTSALPTGTTDDMSTGTGMPTTADPTTGGLTTTATDSDSGGEPPAAPALTLNIAQTKTFSFTWDAVDGATHYRLHEDARGTGTFAQVGGDLTTTATSLYVPLHFRAHASYVLEACNEFGCTASGAVTVTGTLAEAVGYFKGPAPSTGDVAARVALSADGRTLAIGSYAEDSAATGVDGDAKDDSAVDAGAVFVFARADDDTWSPVAYLKAANAEAEDWFGHSLALSADGSTLAVGAPGEDSAATTVDGDQASNAASRAGAVYVFTRDRGGVWSQTAYVKASNAEADDKFGESVALSGDGDTLAVGASLEDGAGVGVGGDPNSNTGINSGAVYLFDRTGGVWSQTAYVKASNTGIGDLFGERVALSGDGDTLAVGAVQEQSGATGIDGDQGNDDVEYAGAVYVYDRNGGAWSHTAYVKASNTGTGDRFGFSLALAEDGDMLAVGAYGEKSAATGIDGDQADDSTEVAGAAYVFARTGGVWDQTAYVKASNTDNQFGFGVAVALSATGDVLAVGARGEHSDATGVDGEQNAGNIPYSGAVYVFERDGGGVWSQAAFVKASNTGNGDRFGDGVALSGDAETLAVGAYGENSGAAGVNGDQRDDFGAIESGAVYLF